MGLDSIFALFGFSEGDDKDLNKMKVDLEVYKETPHFRVGMFVKMIMNGNTFKKQVVKFFAKSDPELDMKGMDEAGEYMMYTRAYFWIQECKVRNKEWKLALQNISDENLLCAVKLSIHYFESTEEFEKCAHLKKIQDFVEKSLVK
jgi:hypothetical protein